MPASDEEVEQLVKCFEMLNKTERGAILRLIQTMAARVGRSGPPAMTRGYARCSMCGERDLCYSHRGTMRCAKCRRRAAEGDNDG